jgi:hypothetical protein
MRKAATITGINKKKKEKEYYTIMIAYNTYFMTITKTKQNKKINQTKRGFDFGNYFSGWLYNNALEQYPYFKCYLESYPNEQEQTRFARAYLKRIGEIKREKSPQEINEQELLNEKNLLNEANHYALMSCLFWSCWSASKAAHSDKEFEYLLYSLSRADVYFKLKMKLFPSGYST